MFNKIKNKLFSRKPKLSVLSTRIALFRSLYEEVGKHDDLTNQNILKEFLTEIIVSLPPEDLKDYNAKYLFTTAYDELVDPKTEEEVEEVEVTKSNTEKEVVLEFDI